MVVLEPRAGNALGLLAVAPKGLAVCVLPKRDMADVFDEARVSQKKARSENELRDWRNLSRDIGPKHMQIKKGSRSHSPKIGEEGRWVGELMGAGELHEEENLVGAVLVWVT